MTVLGIECNGATFLTSFEEGPHQNLFLQGKQNCFQESESKMSNSIVVDIVKYICSYTKI